MTRSINNIMLIAISIYPAFSTDSNALAPEETILEYSYRLLLTLLEAKKSRSLQVQF